MIDELDNPSIASSLSPTRSHAVKAVQRLLYKEDPGPLDGVYGPKTQEAISEAARTMGYTLHSGEKVDARLLDKLIKRAVDELRHTKRDLAMIEMETEAPEVGTLDPISIPNARVRAQEAVESALRHWRGVIQEPPGENWDEIDWFIRDSNAMYWHWLKQYKKNGQSAWCGAFVAGCFGSRLRRRIRQLCLASTARIQDWLEGEGKNWGPTKEHPNRRPHLDRCVFNIHWGPNRDGASHHNRIQPGDVVVVGNGEKKDGNHITLCLASSLEGLPNDVYNALPKKYVDRLDAGRGLLLIEGNAKGYGPNGSKYEGVIVKFRPFKQYVKEKAQYYVMHALRFSDEDYEAWTP